MRYLVGMAAALLLTLLLVFLLRGPLSPRETAAEPNRHQRLCSATLDAINQQESAWSSWSTRGDEVLIRVNDRYFNLPTQTLQTINDALLCAAAPDANTISVVKYEYLDTRTVVLEWKQATGFMTLF